VVSGLFSALGLTWHRRELYVSHIVPHATFAPRHTGRVVAYSGFDGRRFRRSRVVVDGLPVGRHRLDSIVAGPGGRLYLGVGSESDHDPSSSRLAGTVVSFRPNGGGLRVEARGLRNPYGLAFQPGSGRLYASVNGQDELGTKTDPEPAEMAVVIRPGAFYGWPRCWPNARTLRLSGSCGGVMNATSSPGPIWFTASGSMVTPRPAPALPTPLLTTGGSWSMLRSATMSAASFACVWSPAIRSDAPSASLRSRSSPRSRLLRPAPFPMG
jgi:glucose/arabinose dehydrogenase